MKTSPWRTAALALGPLSRTAPAAGPSVSPAGLRGPSALSSTTPMSSPGRAEENVPFLDRTLIVLSPNWPDVTVSKKDPHEVVDQTLLSLCISGVTEYARIFYDLFPSGLLSVCVGGQRAGDELWRVNHWHQQSLQQVMEGMARARFGTDSAAEAGEFGPELLLRALLERGPLLAPEPRGRSLRVRVLWITPHPPPLQPLLHVLARAPALAAVDLVFLTAGGAPFTTPLPEPPAPHVRLTLLSASATELSERWTEVVESQLQLRRLRISGIPMKEKDAGGERAVYEVTLLHPAGNHLARGPVQLVWRGSDKRAGPHAAAGCCAHRITTCEVHAGPTVCLMKHLLAAPPKAVLLGAAGGPTPSHLLQMHGGDVWLHCLPPQPQPHPLELVPAGALLPSARLPPYRFEDFGQLLHAAQVQPRRAGQPAEPGVRLLERATRYWPVLEHDTVLLARDQSPDLRAFTAPIRHLLLVDRPDEAAAELCVSLLARLQAFAAQNEATLFPQLAGAHAARQEAYKRLWQELLTLARSSAALAEASPLKTRLVTAMARLWPDLAPPELRTATSPAAASSPVASVGQKEIEPDPGKRKRERDGTPAAGRRKNDSSSASSLYQQYWSALRPAMPAREFDGRQES